ncbi:MAG: helix-turn-helix domain-containing protein [Actinomycetota bacterium]|nr:helix-turn-helix domain-containing protein [Actinomycetota bacterium]
MDPSAVAAVLISPQGRAAVAAGAAGTVIRLIRRAHGWSQQDLADRSGYSQATISRLERGVSRAARDIAVLTDLAGALGVPSAVLGLVCDPAQRPIIDDVDRREFLGGTAGLAVTALLPQRVATPGRVGAAEVAQCWSALRRLFELDDQHGGATVCQMAAGMARRLQAALRRGSYTTSVGRGLQEVTAATMEHAGWLAYDAGWPGRARQWWLETCHFADLTDVPDVRVTALASMALQASDVGDGRETVGLIQGARKITTNGQGSPLLLSLLAARDAIGHAQAGDRTAAISAIGQARKLLDQGRRGDEPFWLDFWGPADLAWHEARVALATRQSKPAEAAARTALASVDANVFPRNHTAYAVGLGAILTQHGQLDEAISITGEAIQGVAAIRGSGRAVTNLHHTVDMLGQHRYPPAKTFATAARRLLPAVT